jgi:hypothetical protein
VSAVERFCFVRLSDEHATAEGRAAVVARCRAVLAAAPEVLEVTLGVPADDTARKWDVGLVIRCADLAALRALLARPEVAALLDGWLPARAAVIKAWHFQRA